MFALLRSLPLALLAASLAASEEPLELRGRIVPAPTQSSVRIDGADFPYTASTLAGSNGRFRFRRLAPGSYTVTVFVRGHGEVRRTVTVSRSFADSRRRVEVTIPFSTSLVPVESLERRNTVSVQELSVSPRAQSEYERAQRSLNRRNVERAIRHLERAVELSPQFVLAWNNLGTIAYQSGDYEKAESYFRKALEQEPGAYKPTVNLGGVLLNLGRHGEAIQYNRYAVEERPGDALANAQLGMNYFLLENDDLALKYLRRAKRLDPAHFSHPQLVLAEIYLRREQASSAVRELEDFLKRHPDAPNAGKVQDRLKRLRR